MLLIMHADKFRRFQGRSCCLCIPLDMPMPLPELFMAVALILAGGWDCAGAEWTALALLILVVQGCRVDSLNAVLLQAAIFHRKAAEVQAAAAASEAGASAAGFGRLVADITSSGEPQVGPCTDCLHSCSLTIS